MLPENSYLCSVNRFLPLLVGLVALLLACLSACGPSAASEPLARAEAVMDARPDSALHILDSIDASTLSRPDRALYILLHTQAKDKCDIDISGDSLLLYSIDYFYECGDRPHEMRSHYYFSRMRYANGDYAQSIMSASKAYELAEADSAFFWMGMAARSISDVYNDTFNRVEELAYAEREFEAFKASGRQPYVNYACLDLLRARVAHEVYDKAIEMYPAILDSAIYKDDNLAAGVYSYIGMAHIGMNKFSEAVRYYEVLSGIRPLDVSERAYLGVSYAASGNVSKAEEMYAQCDSSPENLKTWLEYEISVRRGNQSVALNASRAMDSLSNVAYGIVISQNLIGSLVGYYDLDLKLRASELKAANTRFWLICALAGAILLIIALLGWYIYRKQQAKIEKNVGVAQQIQERLTTIEKSKENLLTTRYKLLNDLCRIAYECNDSASARRKVSNALIKLIEDFKTNDKKFAELADWIDENYSGVYTRFHSEFPTLSDADLKLFVFSILGFSSDTIAVLLDAKKVTSVYDRKKRLKNRIKGSGSAYLEEYLSRLS